MEQNIFSQIFSLESYGEVFEFFDLSKDLVVITVSVIVVLSVIMAFLFWMLRARSKMNKQLAASDDRLKAIAGFAPVSIGIFDIQTNQWEFVNDKFKRLMDFGFNAISAVERIKGESKNTIAESLELKKSVKGQDTNLPEMIDEEESIFVDSMASRVLSDQKDWLVFVAEDKTEARRVQKGLQESEAKFSATFKQLPIPVLIMEGNTMTVIDANRAFESKFEISTEELKGFSFMTAPFSQNEERKQLFLKNLHENGIIDNWRTTLTTRSGKEREFELSAVMVSYGRQKTVVLSLVDITDIENAKRDLESLNESLEQKAQQRGQELAKAKEDLMRQERLASLGSLVAGIAHELNTPIGNGLTVATSMQAKVKEFAEKIKSNQLRKEDLAKFLSDTLMASSLLERNLTSAADLVAAFKQVSVDQASAKKRTFNLKKCVLDNIMTIQSKLKKQNIALELNLDESITMESFPGELGQVILNFFNNAMLHAFDTELDRPKKIEVITRKEGDFAVIDFKDNGKGIPEEFITRIFDPYFSTKFGQGGSGLGLNIVWNLVHKNFEGKLVVDSKVGVGTTFTMHLKLRSTLAVNEDQQQA